MNDNTITNWIQIGTRVDYHPIIGEPATDFDLVIRAGPQKLPGGQWVVWLEGKAGCVAVEAVSPHVERTVMDIVELYLRQHRYDGLYHSETDCGCHVESLMPCGSYSGECLPGFDHPEKAKEDKSNFWIGPRKIPSDSE